MKRFTDLQIKNLKPEAKLYEITEGDGFSIRVQPSGTKTFYYIYYDAGKKQRIRIGEYGATTLVEAREKAASLHSARKRGLNLKSDKKTVADLAQRYLQEHSKKMNTPRRYKENKRVLDRDVLPHIGTIDLKNIKRNHIYDVVNRIIERGKPAQSNNALKIMRKMFNFGIQSGMTETNPAHMIKQQPEKEKRRVLTDQEIRIFLYGNINAKTSDATMRCLKLILITGQRPGECLGMHYDEISGDWWTIPKERTKNRMLPHATDQKVFLSPLAKEIIGSGSGPVFPSPAQVSALGTALRRLRDRIGIEPFTPHDLRRTAATHMAELGYKQELIDRILGHIAPKIARTYNRYDYEREKEEIMLAWEKKLLSLKLQP